MRLSAFLIKLSLILAFPSVLSLLCLYLYPAAQRCSFPPTKAHDIAPFRLLALADPQLEGDTSLPDPNAPRLPSLTRLQEDVKATGIQALLRAWPYVKTAAFDEVPVMLQGLRKQLDLLGNDFYLAHIYRTMRWWTRPSHVVVLGDLLGSQWIDDEEFSKRVGRYWHRVFAGASLVPIETTATSARIEVLGADKSWSDRVIAVAGNHDIGYAGDIDSSRIARFENAFGHVNWETRFVLGNDSDAELDALLQARNPELRVVVVNTMNIDEPVKDGQLRDETLMFLGRSFSDAQQRDNPREATVVLTHIPLHKEAGICVDAPYFAYFDDEQGGGIREQYHIRSETSQRLLAGLGSRAIILNGHDHEGCDTIHVKTDSVSDDALNTSWTARRYRRSDLASGTREITVRSMMGSYGGNAGLLSAWYDHNEDAWQFEYSTCSVGVQHIWWAVHVLALIEVLLAASGMSLLLFKTPLPTSRSKRKRE